MALVNIANDYKITVKESGKWNAQTSTVSGSLERRVVQVMDKDESDVLMNRLAAGYWTPITQGLVVQWEVNHNINKVEPTRIIEVSVTDQTGKVEYIPTSPNLSDVMFIIATDSDGEMHFVNDYMANDPFTDTFSEAKLTWFNCNSVIDNIVKRGFCEKVALAFADMYANHTINIVWAKLKRHS